MKTLIDMNLSPDWTAAFATQNIESAHWSAIGDPRTEDTEIMEYVRENDYIVFTHDLDFGTLLALTQAMGQSVVQVRAQTKETEGSIGITAFTKSTIRRNERNFHPNVRRHFSKF